MYHMQQDAKAGPTTYSRVGRCAVMVARRTTRRTREIFGTTENWIKDNDGDDAMANTK